MRSSSRAPRRGNGPGSNFPLKVASALRGPSPAAREGWAEASHSIAATGEQPAWPEFANADDGKLKW